MEESKVILDGRFRVYPDGEIYYIFEEGIESPVVIGTTYDVSGAKRPFIRPHPDIRNKVLLTPSRLVAEAYLGLDRTSRKRVFFKDGNPFHYQPENLYLKEAGTQKKKPKKIRELPFSKETLRKKMEPYCRDGRKAGLQKKAVEELYLRREGWSFRYIGLKRGVSRQAVAQSIKRSMKKVEKYWEREERRKRK